MIGWRGEKGGEKEEGRREGGGEEWGEGGAGGWGETGDTRRHKELEICSAT